MATSTSKGSTSKGSTSKGKRKPAASKASNAAAVRVAQKRLSRAKRTLRRQPATGAGAAAKRKVLAQRVAHAQRLYKAACAAAKRQPHAGSMQGTNNGANPAAHVALVAPSKPRKAKAKAAPVQATTAPHTGA